MLLNQTQIALNELIVNLREAADHFTDAASQLDDPHLQALFKELRDEHNAAADIVSETIRKTGALPRAQYADREEVHQIITHVKAAMSDDSRQVFLEDRIDHEQQIKYAIAEALALKLPADTQQYLNSLLLREGVILSRLEEELESRVVS